MVRILGGRSVQVRIGILNQLSEAAITEIVTRFAEALNEMGAEVDMDMIHATLAESYNAAIAAE
jgi:aspartate aminotransferase-like enzyme